MADQADKLAGFQPIQKTSVKDQTMAQLKHYIASGRIAPGERLPSERALAEALGVGRYSVREALKVLEAVGVVESRVGEGTFISDQPGARIGEIIGFSLGHQGGTIMEILDARKIIEIEAARAAAERATEEDLERMAAELDRMQAAADDFRAYLIADMNFHRHIGEASHNGIVARVVNNLIDLLEEVLKETRTDALPTQAESDRDLHHAVYKAIAQRQPDQAVLLMREHIQLTLEMWQTLISITAQAETPDT